MQQDLFKRRLDYGVRLIDACITNEQQLFRLLPKLELNSNVLDVSGLRHRLQYPVKRLPVHLSVESFVLFVVRNQFVQLGLVVDHFVQLDGFQNCVRTAQATNL